MTDTLEQFAKIMPDLKGITSDSRAVKQGYLFAALPGTKADGRDYIQTAINHGARAILAPQGTMLPNNSKNIVLLTHENPRLALAKIAATFYKRQPETMVAVTGTNGKTSTVTFVEQLWQAQGYKATSMGTLKGHMTTPDAVALHANLADFAAAGVTHLALEASSHGLDQFRLDGAHFKAGAFTNLSRDHLDYHKNMDEYFTAKARLFSQLLPEGATAVINADTEEFSKLSAMCERRNIRILSYGRNAKDLKILKTTPTAHGQKVELGVMGTHKDITLPLVGEFQVMNALCALGLCIASDPDHKGAYVNALEKLNGAKGRLELINGHPKGAAIYVDYAHTPDALDNVLKALRPHTNGKLVCVFGCGGNRDQGKRQVMGDIARRLADMVIVTDDNPRDENPSDIRAHILRGAPNAHEIPDRRKAIETAMHNLESGDVLVIAGKGHEQGQIFVDHTDPFDDAQEARKAIEKLKG